MPLRIGRGVRRTAAGLALALVLGLPQTGLPAAQAAGRGTAAVTPQVAPDQCPVPRGSRVVSDAVVRGGRRVLDDGMPGAGRKWAPGRILVRFAPGVPERVRRCIAEAVHGRFPHGGRRLAGLRGLTRMQLQRGVSVADVETVLARYPRHVESSVADVRIVEDSLTDPDDPRVPHWTQPWDAVPLVDKANALWPFVSGRTCISPAPPLCRFVGMDIMGAWSRFRYSGRPGFEVGVIDSGFDYTWPVDMSEDKSKWYRSKPSNYSGHSYVVSRGTVDRQRSVPGPTAKSTKGKVHGTMVSGLIAGYGDNDHVASGVMTRASLVPGQSATLSHALAIMHQMGRDGIEVVNMSLGWISDPKSFGKSTLLEVMAKYPNTLWVKSAGNDSFNLDVDPNVASPYRVYYVDSLSGPAGMRRVRKDFFTDTYKGPYAKYVQGTPTDHYAQWTGCSDRTMSFNGEVVSELGPFNAGKRINLICVAGSTIDGQLARSTSYGPNTVEFAAPGQDVLTYLGKTGDDDRRGRVVPSTGTSFAAPLVTGLASLIRSRFPSLSATEAKCVLMLAAQSSPLPEQDINDISHPAYLQPVDTPVKPPPDEPAYAGNFGTLWNHGPGRAGPGELLRVMGIPNAIIGMDAAEELELNKSLGKDPASPGDPSPCLAFGPGITREKVAVKTVQHSVGNDSFELHWQADAFDLRGGVLLGVAWRVDDSPQKPQDWTPVRDLTKRVADLGRRKPGKHTVELRVRTDRGAPATLTGTFTAK